MERLTNRDKEIPLPNADNALFWARVHEKLAKYEDAEEQAYFASKPKTYCEKYPTGCMFCDLLLRDGKKETAEERCNPCKPTQPECGECEYAKPITKADRIRSMTDEELAELMAQTGTEYSCPPPHYFGETGFCRNEDVDMSCRMCWLDWLRQEASNGQTP